MLSHYPAMPVNDNEHRFIENTPLSQLFENDMIDFFIPGAMAAEAPAGGGAGIPGLDLFIIIAFALVFYFIVWRPQSKRAKEHRELVSSLSKGDEVVTNGGMIGKITRVEDQYIAVEVADKVEIKVQKHAVAAALPKGTIKQI